MSSVTEIRNQAVTGGNTAAPQGKSALGKEDFLKLLVAQLSNQDPLQPTEGAEFVAQLAQFSNLEQSITANTTLASMEAMQKAAVTGNSINLIGKQVTAKADTVTVTTSGADAISATLGGDADQVTAKVYDGSGNLVRSVALGAKKAGVMQATWDGKDDKGNPLKAGTYSIAVEARTDAGGAVVATNDITGVVSSVDMANNKVRVGNTDVSIGRISSVK